MILSRRCLLGAAFLFEILGAKSRGYPSCLAGFSRAHALSMGKATMPGVWANILSRADRRRRAAVFASAASAVMLTGCSAGGIDSPSLALPKVPNLNAVAALAAPDPPIGTPTEIYSRVALGANSCWFGAAGPLKTDYIYNAQADAPSRGGKAEIIIHRRDPSQSNPRGLKTFRVSIDRDESGAIKLGIENLSMPDAIAAAMTSDVNRWARGDQGCVGNSTVAGWGTQEAAPDSAPAKPTAKKKTSKAKPKDAKVTTAH